MDVFTTADLGFSGTDGDCRSTPGRTSPPPTTATTQRLYVNGVQVATRATTGADPAPRPARCASAATASWSNEWFAGLIDEVRVYNKALTAAEIQADMAKPVN